MKPSLYIETSIPSYFVARDSRDVIVLAHQQITRLWWETRLPDFRVFVSPVVFEEAREGDAEQAQRRLAALDRFRVLQADRAVAELTEHYMVELGLPGRAIRDAAHLAFACFYEMDYLVTWNCTHIANGDIIKRLERMNALAGVATPTICTPEELLGMEEEV